MIYPLKKSHIRFFFFFIIVKIFILDDYTQGSATSPRGSEPNGRRHRSHWNSIKKIMLVIFDTLKRNIVRHGVRKFLY